MQQVVETEATGYNKHHALVKLRRNIESDLVVVLKLKDIVFDVIDHSGLLVVEIFPYFVDVGQVLSGYLVEVALQSAQLLFVLFFQHLEVKAQKSLDLRSVFCLEAMNIIIQVFKGGEQPGIQLWPVAGKVLLHKSARHQRQLGVRALSQNAVVGVLNKL